MTAYDDDGFDPPAPVARVVLRHPDSAVSVTGVRMLIDSGADATLLPADRHRVAGSRWHGRAVCAGGVRRLNQ